VDRAEKPVSKTAWTLTVPAEPSDTAGSVPGQSGRPSAEAWLRDPADPAFAALGLTRREWVQTWPWQRRGEAVAAFLAACTDYQEATLQWDPH
jgi:hypothetical protein